MADSNTRDSRPGEDSVLPILHAIRADQVSAAEIQRDQYQRFATAITAQGATLNRLATDVAGLDIRTAAIEAGLQQQAAVLGVVKERQDGCVARLTHADDSTEVRELREQIRKAVSRSTPPRGTATPAPPVGWWSSGAGRSVLAALAALLVALATALTTWATVAPSAPPASRLAPPTATHGARSPQDYQVDDSDLGLAPDTSDPRRGQARP